MGELREGPASMARVSMAWQAFLAASGAVVLLVLFPVLTIAAMRLGLDVLGWARLELWIDWLMRPAALLVVGALLGRLGGREGWLVAVVAAAPAVLTKAVLLGTPLAYLVAAAQFLVAGVGGLVGSQPTRWKKLSDDRRN